MKIVDIRTAALSTRCEPPYGSAGGMQARRGALIVEIETDERITGIGEAGLGGGATQTVIEKTLKPMLIGQDPLLIEALWQRMFARTRQFGRRGVVMNALSGIDIALWDIDGSARVAAALATPIAGYETEVGLYGFRELITRGAVDIVQADLAWAGGFSECRRIAALAQAHHLMMAPHAFAGAVLLAASLHFLAAIPNGLELEFDQNPNGLRDDLLKEPLAIDRDGMVAVPTRPGLGIELDPAAIARYRAG
jgi:L-alanine-DL-glutamate epimerase-like enolase superfamily enzyme